MTIDRDKCAVRRVEDKCHREREWYRKVVRWLAQRKG
jgi:hypothetical protein